MKGLALVALIALGILFYNKRETQNDVISAPAETHFNTGDYIQLKNEPASAIWIITQVNPDLKTTQGTGAYYGRIVRTDSKYNNINTTFMWGMSQVESNYMKVEY